MLGSPLLLLSASGPLASWTFLAPGLCASLCWLTLPTLGLSVSLTAIGGFWMLPWCRKHPFDFHHLPNTSSWSEAGGCRWLVRLLQLFPGFLSEADAQTQDNSTFKESYPWPEHSTHLINAINLNIAQCFLWFVRWLYFILDVCILKLKVIICDLLSMSCDHLFIKVFMILLYFIRKCLDLKKLGTTSQSSKQLSGQKFGIPICKDLMFTQQRLLQRSTGKKFIALRTVFPLSNIQDTKYKDCFLLVW